MNGYKTRAAAVRDLRAAGWRGASLLASPLTNPKVAKNGKLGVLTFPMHLAPARLSGYEVCPKRSAGCTAACLHTAGNQVYMQTKAASRINKTRAYFEARHAFMAVLAFEIASARAKAARVGMECAVRLNATSDIPFERVPLDGGQTLMEIFHDVMFYDYTAIEKRAAAFGRGEFPENYHLTFSAKEDNHSAVIRVLQAGGNVAMVFSTRRGKPLPTEYMGFRVIDADEHDYRPIDPRGVIAGLRAKGDAIGDKSGFVRYV